MGDDKGDTHADLTRLFRFQTRAKGEFLFHEDTPGQTGYFLASGMVKLFKTNPEGREVALAFVSPGELIAWLVLHLEKRYPVGAAAIAPVELLAFDIGQIQELLNLSPSFALHLLGYLAERQLFYLNSIKDLALSEPKTRFLNYLRHLSRHAGSGPLQLPVSKKQIALLIGVTPETLSRLLGKLCEDGVIAVDGKNIRLLAAAGQAD